MKHGQGKIVKGSPFPHEGFIEIRVLPAQTVVGVGDMELESVFLGKEKKDIEEAEAVSAARNTDNKAFFLAPELMRGDGILDTLQKSPYKRSESGAISSPCAF